MTTLLAELTCNATFAPSAALGKLTLNAIASDASANATGTATWFRIVKSDGSTLVCDGDVGTSGSDLNLNSTSITAGGTVAGVGGSIAAIGAAGAVSGFSAAGITSGLAAIGGGAMLTGIGVVAAVPVATGLLGYGLVKGIKAICKANNLSCTEVNERWEIRTKDAKQS